MLYNFISCSLIISSSWSWAPQFQAHYLAPHFTSPALCLFCGFSSLRSPLPKMSLLQFLAPRTSIQLQSLIQRSLPWMVFLEQPAYNGSVSSLYTQKALRLDLYLKGTCPSAVQTVVSNSLCPWTAALSRDETYSSLCLHHRVWSHALGLIGSFCVWAVFTPQDCWLSFLWCQGLCFLCLHSSELKRFSGC